MNRRLTYRPLLPYDARNLEKLVGAVQATDIFNRVNDPDIACWAVVCVEALSKGERIRGVIQYEFFSESGHNTIDYVYVQPSLRRKRIGSALVSTVLSIEAGTSFARVPVASEFLCPQKFFASCGYKGTEEDDTYQFVREPPVSE